MNVDRIVVQEYLESLTEKKELNKIFPLLLESMGFVILSKPTEYIGIQEYGKDIVAIGELEDRVKKRFYFELKGGDDRNITSSNFYGKDGIQESLMEASYNKFVSAYKGYDDLPLEIVIVHNGVLAGNIQSTYENFIKNTQASLIDTTFDRWDIGRLTTLFQNNLFGPYLLPDDKTTRAFNRVLINMDIVQGVSGDFINLLDYILNKEEWKNKRGTIPRRWIHRFESLKLVSLIVYTESKRHENLDICKRHLTHLVLYFWYWILKNKLDNRQKVVTLFDQILGFYQLTLKEYFDKTIPLALEKDGLFFPNGGPYEQVGYTCRTHDFNFMLTYMLSLSSFDSVEDKRAASKLLSQCLNQNSVSARPLLDIHSLSIVNIVNVFIKLDEIESARIYLRNVIGYIIFAKENNNRLPDASNNVQNLIKFFSTGIKPIYYIDSTSSLIVVLLELVYLLNMENEFIQLRDFVIDQEIDLGIFIPHHGKNSSSKSLIENTNSDLEELLFSESVNEGYQRDVSLLNDSRNPLTFSEFGEKFNNCREEFSYEYRTDTAGFDFIRQLAHHYFKTPYFPDKWRGLQIQ